MTTSMEVGNLRRRLDLVVIHVTVIVYVHEALPIHFDSEVHVVMPAPAVPDTQRASEEPMAPINVLVDAPEQLPQIPQQSSSRDRLPPREKVLPDKRKNVAAPLLHPPSDVPSVPKTSSLDLPLKAPGVPEGPPPELLDNTESEKVGIPVINVENAAEENDFSVSPQSWKIFSDDGPHCPPSGDHDLYSTGFQKDVGMTDRKAVPAPMACGGIGAEPALQFYGTDRN
ncbi:hypothetical protein HPB52_005614 [Rhipicephalus sanguineus]|uniref:Uncharacterized protein n=1 Tax=Rhipicephalus sanguineus TaxID=34632 RepID=A0A9D4T019_RHISA|nr:hypothetical protein HPB52_005614 [Rhipicephalus sanguineus]